MNKPKKTYSDEYKANRRKNQNAWLAKKRQDPLWVHKQSKKKAPIMTTNGVPPSPLPEDVVKELIKEDKARINRLRIMYKMFEATGRSLAGEDRRKRNKEESPDLPDYTNGVGDDAIKALHDRNIMFFVNEFKYELYVKVLTKEGTIEHLGPYCTPSQVLMNAGGIRPTTALKRALDEAKIMRNTKQRG